MTVAQAIVHPTATVNILAEITAGIWVRAWVADGTYTNSYKVDLRFTNGNGKTNSHTVTAVSWNRSTALTAQSSASAVNSNAGSWYHDGTYLWVRPVSGSIFDATVQATVKFYVGVNQKVLNSIYWDPRIESAPSISQRIEAVFGDVGQVGGGTLALKNADGFFNQLEGLQWNAGTVTLKVGVDLPGGDMAWADYETLATWRIEDWQDDGDSFELKLVEPKSRVKAKIPIDVFSRDDYPNIDDQHVGKPIPIAYGANYGVEPICVNPGTKTFKVAGHAIKGFDAVRLKKSRIEIVTRSTTGSEWLPVSATVRRFYIADETIKSVTAGGVELTEVNDVEDLASGNWAYVENYLYAYPSTSWSDALAMVSRSEVSSESMVETEFESKDLANGEFTLGDDWSVGTTVAVDFRGKVSGTDYLENAVDIIEDLLTVAGETNLNSSSFSTARARLLIGLDEENNEVNALRPSLYLVDPSDIIDLIGDILGLARGYLYSDATGQYSVGIFEPTPGEECPTIDDTEIVSLEKRFDASDVVSTVIAHYQPREVDGYSQTFTEESAALQYVNDQPSAVIKTEDLITAFESDARYWAEAALILYGRPLAKHQVVVPWKFLTLDPGDQVLIQSDQFQIDQVFEVLEKRVDLMSKIVTLIVGNLRAFADSPGVWVADSATLPSRFSTLTGYGSGSLTWNSSWDDEIKNWARQNVGYWTDANGFATTSDSESFNASVWT